MLYENVLYETESSPRTEGLTKRMERPRELMWETDERTLPDIPDDKFWWLALVQLEKNGMQDLLAEEEEGAYVWVAAIATELADVDQLIRAAADAERLRVIGIEDHTVVEDLSEIEEADEHLADDVFELGPGQRVAWGTWHVYYGEGEA